MKHIDNNHFTEDWLAGNAVVTAVGGLIFAQYWQRTYSAYEVPILNLTIPNFADSVVCAIIALLVFSSLLMTLSSLLVKFRSLGTRIFVPLAPYLWGLIWFSFLVSWVSAMPDIDDKWMYHVMLGLGIGMLFLFIPFRIIRSISQISDLEVMLKRRFRSPEARGPAVSQDMNEIDLGLTNSKPATVPRLVIETHSARSHRPPTAIGRSYGFWVIAAMTLIVVEVLLTVLFWNWLSGMESTSATVRNVGLLVLGSIAILLAIWRALVADRQDNAAQLGLVNERYQRGAEMLGHDVLAVRMGGIFALRDLAKQHPEQCHVQTIRLLCAFARNPPRDRSDEEELASRRRSCGESLLALGEDLQAVIDVIRARSDVELALERAGEFRLQLQHADLSGADLHGANLRNAFLRGTNLSGALLAGTRMDSADLTDAMLSNSQFSLDGESPASGLTQQQLDKAKPDPESGPKLTGVLDAATGKPLVWRQGRMASDT